MTTPYCTNSASHAGVGMICQLLYGHSGKHSVITADFRMYEWTTENRDAIDITPSPKPRPHGLNAEEAAVAVPIISANEGKFPDTPNAKCNRCGRPLRAKPDMLRYVKQGIVGHAACGGTFLVAEDIA